MKPLLKTAILALIASNAIWAQDRANKTDVKPVPAHTPEWTNPDASDPGTTDSVVDELGTIVVLCATEPDSGQFRKAWKNWLASNYRPGMEVDAIISDVIRRADEHRNKTGKKKRSSQSSKKIVKNMHDTARNAINNIG
jgi:hypothetical protein